MADNVMYPSAYAREAAMKKMREEAEAARAAQEEAERIEREKREEKERKKQAALDRAAKAAEKLAEAQRKRAAEAEAEAERVGQILREKEEAVRQAREKARQEAEARRNQALKEQAEAEQRAREAQREKERQLMEERERKRQQRAEQMQKEHEEADKRWLKQKVSTGEIKLQKKGSFVTAVPTQSSSTKLDTSWIKVAQSVVEEDSSIPVEVLVDEEAERQKAEEAEAERKRVAALMNMAVVSSEPLPKPADNRWILQEGVTVRRAVPQVKPNPLSAKRQDIQGIMLRLDTPHERNNALLDLFAYLAKLVAYSGAEKVVEESTQGTNVGVYQKTPPVVAKILKEQPGNILCMLILGLQAFTGNADVRESIIKLGAIPPSADGWIGWLLGTKLFFQYMRFKAESGESWIEFEEFGFGDDDGKKAEVHPNQVKVRRHAAEGKMRELIIGISHEKVSIDEADIIMQKFNQLHDKFLSKTGGFDTFLSDAEASRKAEFNELPSRQEAEHLQKNVQVAQKSLNELRQAVMVEKDMMKAAMEERDTVRRQIEDLQQRLRALGA